MSHDARHEHPVVLEVLQWTEENNPGQTEFLQAVREVVASLGVVLDRHPEMVHAKVLHRMIEPERVVQFRVPWVNDAGDVQVHRGYRVAMSSSLGPYKGGLRFHPTVNLSILKFLAFEQIFKNSLTTLPIGGGKGGSNFDPRGCSDGEVMRFCQAFMAELHRHIGENTDVPAGDIGVGGREIGYLFGMFKKLTNRFTGVLTGKGIDWGGSQIRVEATGYGCVYFAAHMLQTREDTLEGKRCLVSGSGNVAQYCCEKLLQLGAKPITVSDSGGWIHDPDGIDEDKLRWIMELKNVRRGRIHEYADHFSGATFQPQTQGATSNGMWALPAECAFPCATQNEINDIDAKALVDGGVQLVSEGANMPTTAKGQDVLLDSDVLYGPGKAANAGGVAVSALEMAQGSQRLRWSRQEVDRRLQDIMKTIHHTCVDAAEQYGCPGNYVDGANIAGFLKVAGAMMDQGVV